MKATTLTVNVAANPIKPIDGNGGGPGIFEKYWYVAVFAIVIVVLLLILLLLKRKKKKNEPAQPAINKA
jgi:hypothetical protein